MREDRVRETYFTKAIAEALQQEMERDETVIVLGEDVVVGPIGGTKGLFDRFGPDRVRNTPISEQVLVGACVGAAACGLRPVFDMMFSSFMYLAMDQLGNQAARLRYMSGGQFQLPAVFMAGSGPGGSLAAQHSETPHAMLMHLSGLKVVYPSTPRDAKGLMTASVRDPNPVAYFVDLSLAGQKGPVPEGEFEIPLGSAEVKREGADVTVVAVGPLVPMALEIAGELESHGYSIEVVDPRTLVPLDWPTIATSIAKTKRLVVADHGRQTCGAAAEIVARAAELEWGTLRQAPRRVTWEDVPVPFSPSLEEAMLVTPAKLRAAILATLEAPEPRSSPAAVAVT
jgi:acetoin:2,6-dichlorophenolindophenol oxidoreductase subunit beta